MIDKVQILLSCTGNLDSGSSSRCKYKNVVNSAIKRHNTHFLCVQDYLFALNGNAGYIGATVYSEDVMSYYNIH